MRMIKKIGYRCLLPTFMFFLGYATHSLFSVKINTSQSLGNNQPLQGTTQFLVILVLSSVDNLERRTVIRETWAKTVDVDAKVYFVISGGSFTATQKSSISAEQKAHRDLLILPNVEDSFHTLTMKVLTAFSWLTAGHLNIQSNNVTQSRPFSSFSYVLKCDDDSYVRVREILTELRTTYTSNMLYWGFFDGRARVKKIGKYKELSWNICDTYLPYALGGGYVLAAVPVIFITKNAKEWRKYQSEDTSVGAWLANLDGVQHVHDPRFDTEYLSRGCHQTYLVTHKHSVQALRKMHEHLTTTGQLCPKEYRTRLSYRYDWNVPPSKCCAINNPNIP